MMSQTSRYALNVLGFLAAHPQRMVASEEIAQATGLPANYLAKILNRLRKARLVDSQKGWGGGFRLHEGALRRTLAEVVDIMDGMGAAGRDDCLYGRPHCDPQHPCALHERWAEVRDGYTAMLSRTRVEDLV